MQGSIKMENVSTYARKWIFSFPNVKHLQEYTQVKLLGDTELLYTQNLHIHVSCIICFQFHRLPSQCRRITCSEVQTNLLQKSICQQDTKNNIPYKQDTSTMKYCLAERGLSKNLVSKSPQHLLRTTFSFELYIRLSREQRMTSYCGAQHSVDIKLTAYHFFSACKVSKISKVIGQHIHFSQTPSSDILWSEDPYFSQITDQNVLNQSSLAMSVIEHSLQERCMKRYGLCNEGSFSFDYQ